MLDSQKGIDAWTRAAERLRANLAVGFLGFSATTGLQQILGYSQTFEFFSKIGAKRYVFRGMQQFITKPFETVEFVKRCREVHGLAIAGLMCIPPVGDPPAPHFALLDELARRCGVAFRSMGMSADYETAIGQGATHVRVGSAIFGYRDYGAG